MAICRICCFETQADDVAVGSAHGGGRCICLRCYARETGTTRTMPLGLQQTIVRVLDSLEVEVP